MKNLINEALLPLINSGKLSMTKINALIEIKDFVDRVSSKNYLLEDPEKPFEKLYGATPDIVSWGDYFQSDLAVDACVQSDEDFQKLVDTVKFDIMSSFEIFSNNSEEFSKWVEEVSMEIKSHNKKNFSLEEKEILHLDILRNYYNNMDINGNFLDTEVQWYVSFTEKEAIGS